MNPLDIQVAFAVIDGLTTGIEFVVKKINEAKRDGSILTPEQEAKLAAVDAHRKAVGL
jgi:hypothetical protein